MIEGVIAFIVTLLLLVFAAHWAKERAS